MKPIKTIFTILCASILLFSFWGCEDEDDNGGNGSDFNRQALLENTANNIIIPNYQTLENKTKTLEQKIKDFTSSPGANTLDDAQNAFEDAYIAWQHCSSFEFGPAMSEVLRKNVNTFPTDDSTIEQHITSGNYDLTALYSQDQKGFPALDYLLYGKEGDAAVVDSFTSGMHASNRKTYIKDVVGQINDKVQTVHNGWQSNGGNYIETFINNTGTEDGSSLSLLVNELNKDWEIIKNDELGIPLGKKSLGTKFPEKVQAYYSGISVQLAHAHAEAIENIYLGKARSGADGKGLDEYLQSLDATFNDQPLAKVIREQFTTCKQKIQDIPAPLSASVNDAESKVDEAFSAVQKNVALLKTDMTSAMGVQITYQDNDGD